MSKNDKNKQPSADSSLEDCQADMRRAYYSGAPGVVASATAWLVAGLVALFHSPQKSVWALFVGGMLIHPVGVLLAKLSGRSGAHTPGNPLGHLAMETTVWLILSLPLTYTVSLYRIEWFFPAMLVVIGGRYLTFSTLFGSRRYWLFGATLGLASYALLSTNSATAVSALTGAAIEVVFAVILFAAGRRQTTH